eukprot:1069824-Pyramimonas_sp.AAC.1
MAWKGEVACGGFVIGSASTPELFPPSPLPPHYVRGMSDPRAGGTEAALARSRREVRSNAPSPRGAANVTRPRSCQ